MWKNTNTVFNFNCVNRKKTVYNRGENMKIFVNVVENCASNDEPSVFISEVACKKQ